MERLVRSTLVLGTLLAGAAAPLPASAAELRPVVSVHSSFTGFDARVRAGAVVSVVQRCPAGSSLDASATRAHAARGDAELQPTVRRISRELWPSGMVSRYRVLAAAAVPRDDGFGLVNTAFCRGSAPVGARSVSGRASTDVRVWGPAASGARLFSVTLAAVMDRAPHPEGASDSDLPYVTAVRAAGVQPSRGALPRGVRAEQRANDDEGSGTVLTTGTTRRSVPRGRFVSMRSSYAYTADLTRRITVTQAPEPVMVVAGGGAGQGARCTVEPAQVGAGEREVALVALGGPASAVVRDSSGTVVLELTAVRQEHVPGEGGPPVHGGSEPVTLTLRAGTYAVECRPEGGPVGTATLVVTDEAPEDPAQGTG